MANRSLIVPDGGAFSVHYCTCTVQSVSLKSKVRHQRNTRLRQNFDVHFFVSSRKNIASRRIPS